jgi:large subunit ribosomal protein L28
VKLKVSTKGMRLIDKLGIEQVVSNLREQGQRV